MVATKQSRFVVPQKHDLYKVVVRTGIYAGVWGVDRQLVRTPNGIFKPVNEGLTPVQAYDALQNYPALLEEGFELPPVSVLLYGIQNDRRFYEMLRGTRQLTGSGVVDSRRLGTPNVTGGDLKYQGLRSDRPTGRIESQNGRVVGLDKTTLWGISERDRRDSEDAKHPTYMYNADGNQFVVLGVWSGGVVYAYAVRRPFYGPFAGGARLAKRIE